MQQGLLQLVLLLLTLHVTPISSEMLKTIKQVMARPQKHWVGDGFNVYPVFAVKAFAQELSPFLMFDYGAPKRFAPNTQAKLGVGSHPHRGFETVTIAFQGEVEHSDSTGNSGIIGPGDVQWMTAARGIIHEEYHSRKFAKEGGVLEMCQLWVNLPAAKKLVPPRYQTILKAQISAATSPLYERDSTAETCSMCPDADGAVRVIAGAFKGARGPASTHTQIDMWDISLLNTEKTFEFDTVEGNNVIIFVRRGGIDVQGRSLGAQDVAILETGGTRVHIKANEPGTQVLLLAGEPLDEPIASHGPMVMNTQEELQQAFEDYNSGSFGLDESQRGR